MNMHHNARLTPRGRVLFVRRITEPVLRLPGCPVHLVRCGRAADAMDRQVRFDAAGAGKFDTLAGLFEQGMNPLLERHGLTALHVAALQGHLEAVQLPVDSGVDVGLEPDETERLLARFIDREDLVRMLRRFGGRDQALVSGYFLG